MFCCVVLFRIGKYLMTSNEPSVDGTRSPEHFPENTSMSSIPMSLFLLLPGIPMMRTWNKNVWAANKVLWTENPSRQTLVSKLLNTSLARSDLILDDMTSNHAVWHATWSYQVARWRDKITWHHDLTGSNMHVLWRDVISLLPSSHKLNLSWSCWQTRGAQDMPCVHCAWVMVCCLVKPRFEWFRMLRTHTTNSCILRVHQNDRDKFELFRSGACDEHVLIRSVSWVLLLTWVRVGS